MNAFMRLAQRYLGLSSLALTGVLIFGACQQQASPGGGGSTDPEEKLDAAKPTIKRDGAAPPKDAPIHVGDDARPEAGGAGGGGEGGTGGAGGADAAVPA